MFRRLIKCLIVSICLVLSGSSYASQSDAGAAVHIYNGRYTNYSDIILTYGGPVPVPFLMMGVL
jgi:hypothetical protein